MKNNPIAVFVLDPLFWVMIAVFIVIIMSILALYYSVFKRMKMNFQVKAELERLLKENDLALQQFWKDEAALLEKRLQEQEKELSREYKDHEILNMESATALLKSLGWSVKIEGKGDHLATYCLPDREVQFLYHDEKVKDCPQFDLGLAVTSGILAAACETLNPYHSKSLPGLQLDFQAKGLEIFAEKVSVGRLKQALETAVERAMETVDLQAMLRSQYGVPPWERDTLFLVKGEDKMVPYDLRHLAALALLGDVETLLSYSKSFPEGDQLALQEKTFDAYVEKVHLERAIVLAQEVARLKQFNYDLLEQVAINLFPEETGISYQYFRAGDPLVCNRKRALHRKFIEEKKQQLREQGFIVCEEKALCEVDGKNYCYDILYIEDGELKFMDIKSA
ncbi:DUF6990 domain-containing protein [Bartonella sp. MM73XJBT]|uniref:DUF6990 domain-containing protein n=1 Tax=Bartonella sp. MM73XJBT TaxID=3019095 RepID=UPI00235F0825|nr:hypothetical protein [Bartonella sp. MM73XJBT]